MRMQRLGKNFPVLVLLFRDQFAIGLLRFGGVCLRGGYSLFRALIYVTINESYTLIKVLSFFKISDTTLESSLQINSAFLTFQSRHFT